MTLHSSRSSSSPYIPYPDTAPESLQYSLDRMTYFARNFNSKVGHVDPEGISPFAALGVYIAQGMQWRDWVAGGDEKCFEGAVELQKMLEVFQRRWRGACEFLPVS